MVQGLGGGNNDDYDNEYIDPYVLRAILRRLVCIALKL